MRWFLFFICASLFGAAFSDTFETVEGSKSVLLNRIQTILEAIEEKEGAERILTIDIKDLEDEKKNHLLPAWLSHYPKSKGTLKSAESSVFKPLMEIKGRLASQLRAPAETPLDAASMLASIETLQQNLATMMAEMRRPCDPVPPRVSPFLDVIQNVTQQQNAITQTILDFWSQQPPVPALEPLKPRSATDNEKLAGLQNAIVRVLEDLVPKLSYIEQFDSSGASEEDWKLFTETIRDVAEKLKNKTIAQVLGPEKVQTVLEYYDKYLQAAVADQI